MHALDQEQATQRRSRNEGRQAGGEPARIDRVKTIHVLGQINCRKDFLRVDLLRKRQLDQNTADFLVAVELRDKIHQLGFAYRCRKLESKARIPDSATALDLLRT